jgi:hypothetical protein
MPWSSPLGLLTASGQNLTINISADDIDQDTYNVYDELSGPADPVIVTINIDTAADVGAVVIDNRFNVASTFTINLTGSARIVGAGGGGGDGGYSEWAPTFNFPADDGVDGGPAILSAFDFDLDADAGYILGGGGGGGGGAAQDASMMGDESGGGGGGGGQGFNDATGGSGGSPGGLNGTAGSISSGGAGGTSSTSGGTGGTGGDWGIAGADGGTATGGDIGSGGAAGNAIEGTVAITVTLTGTKNQTTLETENRLEGGYTNVSLVDPPP